MVVNENEGGYFCYLSVKMKQRNIDVNVHPSKRTIKFINETKIS
jgi:DNA mismatch repair ATPase MutL